jgi:hypothetical protein
MQEEIFGVFNVDLRKLDCVSFNIPSRDHVISFLAVSICNRIYWEIVPEGVTCTLCELPNQRLRIPIGTVGLYLRLWEIELQWTLLYGQN